MMKFLASASTAMLIAFTLMMFCNIIAKKTNMDREKMSPFECGFDPYSSPRMPFSIQFFLIAILFLIFDIELVIILPIIPTLKTSIIKLWMFTMMLFSLILMIGLFHEWNNGVLEWKY